MTLFVVPIGLERPGAPHEFGWQIGVLQWKSLDKTLDILGRMEDTLKIFGNSLTGLPSLEQFKNLVEFWKSERVMLDSPICPCNLMTVDHIQQLDEPDWSG